MGIERLEQALQSHRRDTHEKILSVGKLMCCQKERIHTQGKLQEGMKWNTMASSIAYCALYSVGKTYRVQYYLLTRAPTVLWWISFPATGLVLLPSVPDKRFPNTSYCRFLSGLSVLVPPLFPLGALVPCRPNVPRA